MSFVDNGLSRKVHCRPRNAVDGCRSVNHSREVGYLIGAILTDQRIELDSFEAVERNCLSNACALQGALL